MCRGESGIAPGKFDLQFYNGDRYGGGYTASPSKRMARTSCWMSATAGSRCSMRPTEFVRAWGRAGMGSAEYQDPIEMAVAPDGSLGSSTTAGRSSSVTMEMCCSWVPFQCSRTRLDPRGRVARRTTKTGSRSMPTAISITARSRRVRRQGGGRRGALQVFGDTAGFGRFSDQPGHIAIDARGYVFVTDEGPQRGGSPGVMVFQPDGTYLTGFGSVGTAEARLTFPDGIVLDGRGNLYVVDALATHAGTSARGAIELAFCSSHRLRRRSFGLGENRRPAVQRTPGVSCECQVMTRTPRPSRSLAWPPASSPSTSGARRSLVERRANSGWIGSAVQFA